MTAEVLEKPDTIRLRLVTNPFDTTNVIEEELVFNEAFTLADYMDGLPSPESWVVGIQGVALRKDLWDTAKPTAGEMISLVRVPEGGGDSKDILRLVALIALAVFAPQLAALAGLGAIGTAVLTAAIIVGGSLVINALLPPPGLDLPDNSREISTSYGIDGPKNTNRQGITVPVGYGQYRVGGNYCDLYTENIGDTQYLFARTVLNDGEIEEVIDIEINEQPITNFNAVETRVDVGLETGVANPWFPNSVSLVNRNVKIETVYITHTTEGPVDKLRLDIVAPNGLVEFDNKGNEKPVRVEFDIEYRVFGSVGSWQRLPVRELTAFTGVSTTAGIVGPGVITGPTFPDTTFVGIRTQGFGTKPPGTLSYIATDTVEYREVGSGTWLPFGSSDVSYNGAPAVDFTPTAMSDIQDPGYERYYEKQLPPAQYEFRSTGSNIVDGILDSYLGFVTGAAYQMQGISTKAQRKSVVSVELPRERYEVRIRRLNATSTETTKSDTVYLTDIGEIDTTPVRMNGTATLSARIKVTDQINNTPSLTALCKLSKLREFDDQGTLLATRWSANPAWIVLDILTHPLRGASMSLSRFDWPAWVEFAQHCEAESLEFNGVFDASTTVWDAVQTVLRCGHAQVVRMGTKWSISIDRASDPVMLFTDSNMIEGTLSTSWLSMTDRANEIQITYQDASDGFRQAMVRMVDNDIAVSGEVNRVAAFQARGVTNAAQAAAEAEYQLRRNRIIRKSIGFDAPIEAIGLSLGEVALIQYQAGDYAGGAGGRCAAGSTITNVKLDRPVVIEPSKSYRLLVHHSAAQRYSVTITSISGKNVFVSGLPTGTINKCTRLRQGDVDLEIIDIIDGSPDLVKVVSSAGLVTGAATLWDTNVVEERTITTGAGEHEQLSVSAAFSVAPTTYANWMFGEVTRVRQPFRLIGLSGDAPTVRSLSFIEYDERLYLPPGTDIPDVELTPTDRPQQVRDLSAEYKRYPTADQPSLLLQLRWGVADILKYAGADVYLNQNNAGWRSVKTVNDTLAADVEITEGNSGVFKVVGFDKLGRRTNFFDAPTVGFGGDITYRTLATPTNLTVDSRRYDILSRLTVSWDAPIGEVVGLYRVDYKKITQTLYDEIEGSITPIQPPVGATEGEIAAWNTGWTTAFVTTDLAGIVEDLNEGYYLYRVRAERGQSVSRWEVITHILDVPDFIDAVTGLQLDGGGIIFTGKDAAFTWDDIFVNAAATVSGDVNGIPFVLRHYQIEIKDTLGALIRTETTEVNSYTYTYEKNVADSVAIVDKARRAFSITVKGIGRQGQISAPATLSVSNPPPALPAVEIVSMYGSVILKFSEPTDIDFEGMLVWKTHVNGVAVDTPAGPPAFTSGISATFAENATGTVYTAVAVDPNGTAVTYSISGGADAAKFTINSSSGAVTFITPPDFEAPTDVGANNVYNITITASDGTLSASQNVAITVTDVTEGSAPVFTSGATASFAENATGTVYTAAASGAATITYSIPSGADVAKFSINGTTGAVTFVTPPDFETPTDVGANNVYNITVRATNSFGSADLAVAITVTDVAEGTAPTFTSSGTASFAENATGTAYTAVATGSGPITYSIFGGADAADFSINGTTGAVTFAAIPNFEAPADAGVNNVYDIVVRATNSFGSTDLNVAITVTDVAEGGGYEAEADALFARMSVDPGATRKGHINTLIASLKSAGAWSRMTGFYMYAAHDKQTAYLNWVAANSITEAGLALTHTVDSRITGLATGNTDFLQTVQGLDALHTETDAHYGVRLQGVKTYNTVLDSFGTFAASRFDDNSGSGLRGRVHNGPYFTFGGLTPGHYILSQTAGTLSAHKNGAQAPGSPVTQTAPSPNGTYRLLKSNGYGTPPHNALHCFHIGGSLTTVQATAVYNAINTYLVAVGAV